MKELPDEDASLANKLPASYKDSSLQCLAFFTGSNRGICAVNASSGKILWKSPTNAFFESSPCVVTDKGVAFHSAISGMRN